MKRICFTILAVAVFIEFVSLKIVQAAGKYPVKPIECIVRPRSWGRWGRSDSANHAKSFTDIRPACYHREQTRSG